MRRLFLTLSALFLLTIYSRGDEIVLYDAKTEQSEYVTRVEIPDRGFMFRVDFTSVNCDSLELNFGYSFDDIPAYLDSVPRYNLPIILDKTNSDFYIKYQGREYNTFPVDVLDHNGKHIWIEIIDKITCTSGQVILKI